jgi:cyclase
MTRIRVVPILLLSNSGMVKTRNFTKPRYLGDPINAVKIFNDKRADELAVLDIEATSKRRIDYDWVSDIVSEAFMPIAYGGGINSLDQCVELFKRGVEKIVINSAVPKNPKLITEVAERYGAQAVVVSIDVKRNFWGKNKVYTHNGRKETKFEPTELARLAEQHGAGEIIVTSIEREGTFLGYDTALLRTVSGAVCVPIVANGGAAKVGDFEFAVNEGKCGAVAASSMFVFAAKGEGVLINYPAQSQLEEEFWCHLA